MWTIKIMYPFSLFLGLIVRAYIINETKRVPYKIIHTGEKIHAGGCKNGFVKLSYQIESNIIKVFDYL